MTFFPSIAVAVALAFGGSVSLASAAVDGQPPVASIRSRQLDGFELSKFFDYKFEHNMDDHARIDRDQQAIEAALAVKTSTSFDNALTIYTTGGHSKSYARVTVRDDGGLPFPVQKGADIKGKTADGATIHAKAYESADAGDDVIEVQYPTDEKAGPCFVGALNLVDMEETTGCLAPKGTLTIGNFKVAYKYNVEEENVNGRTIEGFSLAAQKKMYECPGCPYPEYKAFVEYYQDFEYADDWVKSAMSGKATPFPGEGNADFSKFNFIGRGEAMKKGAAYMNVWMYVIRELRDAIDDCRIECDLMCSASDLDCNQCNDEPVKAWDEAVAFYTGSLAGRDGHGDGYLLYSLANKRGLNFGTNTEGMSWVNEEIFDLFHKGAKHLSRRDCDKVEQTTERIVSLMIVPLVQGTLRYAHKLSSLGSVHSDDADTLEKHNAEGASFAAAILPMLHNCNQRAAREVYHNMQVGERTANFPVVKSAFESNYKCLGITCDDVGGVLNDESKFFLPGAAPCGDGSLFKRYINGSPNRGSYASSSNGGGGGKLSAGAIAGITIGAVVGLLALVVGVKMVTKSDKEQPSNLAPKAGAVVESYSAEDTGEKSII